MFNQKLWSRPPPKEKKQLKNNLFYIRVVFKTGHKILTEQTF